MGCDLVLSAADSRLQLVAKNRDRMETPGLRDG